MVVSKKKPQKDVYSPFCAKLRLLNASAQEASGLALNQMYKSEKITARTLIRATGYSRLRRLFSRRR